MRTREEIQQHSEASWPCYMNGEFRPSLSCPTPEFYYDVALALMLEVLLDASPSGRPERKAMMEFLSRNADAAWANRLDTGLFGVRWDKVFPHGHQSAAQGAGLDLLLAASSGAEPAAPKVCLYDKAGFGGAAACYQVPTEIWMLPETLQDRTSSIKVFPGACLTVYEHHGYTGESREITSSEGWLGDEWNDKITSLRAYPCDS